jgi:ABC-type multidrug transport system fused ATPase/permease subunit
MSAVARGMKKVSGKLSDAYDRPARLYPGFIALSPIAVLIICAYGQQKILMSSGVTIVASCGGAYALSRIVRNAGQRLQAAMFQAWGGAPTTQLLRHTDAHFDVHTKERFHKALSKGIGKKLPTADIEARDPAAADALYRAATLWLINQTRDTKKFPLVFKENIAFGFQRNALGLRFFGIVVALACLAWGVLLVVIQSAWALREVSGNAPPPVLFSMLYSVLILGAWMFVFTEAALKRTGFSYAERLIQSLDFVGAPARRTVAKDS